VTHRPGQKIAQMSPSAPMSLALAPPWAKFLKSEILKKKVAQFALAQRIFLVCRSLSPITQEK
jgi:hypothetical protein